MSPEDRNRPSDPPPRGEIGDVKRQLQEVNKQLHALETRTSVQYEETKGRFTNGYESFEGMRKTATELGDRITKLEAVVQPKKQNWLSIAGFVLSLLIVTVSVITTTSRYVDRETLERTADKSDAQSSELRDEVYAMRNQVTRLEAELASIRLIERLFERNQDGGTKRSAP